MVSQSTGSTHSGDDPTRGLYLPERGYPVRVDNDLIRCALNVPVEECKQPEERHAEQKEMQEWLAPARTPYVRPGQRQAGTSVLLRTIGSGGMRAGSVTYGQLVLDNVEADALGDGLQNRFLIGKDFVDGRRRVAAG